MGSISKGDSDLTKPSSVGGVSITSPNQEGVFTGSEVCVCVFI